MKGILGTMAYDIENDLLLDEFCLGKTSEEKHLMQLLFMTSRKEYYMMLVELPDNEQYVFRDLGHGEIFALTEELAIERFNTKFWDRNDGRFQEFAIDMIDEFLEEEGDER